MPSNRTIEETLEVPGSRLWIARRGAGPALVLCSGGPGCCDYLEPVAAMLDDCCETVRFEPRGCGRSSPEGPFDLDTCIADLEAIRAHLGCDRWIVAGHSFGADLALAYALAHPDRARGLAHLCAHGFHDDRGWSDAYHREHEARGEALPDYAFPPNPEVNRVGNASLRRYVKRPSLWRDVGRLRVPTLVVTAERDLRPPWPALQIARLLPDARHVEIAGAEHTIWLEHADPLRAVLRDFVGEVLARR